MKASLLQTDEDFSSWFRSITTSTNGFATSAASPTSATQQQFEEISLKKRKLALKDRIEAIMRSRTATPLAMPSQ